ncbi:MAG: bifunctional acetate--CoA ligase family protein/GNAT family N-acetyltransferase [Rhodospirillaceae bacterium]|nr:bifunctional acetate--CoA ligase family protein/GNAT family N-acetyltransferase [Rhodospirillaceae bacterium]
MSVRNLDALMNPRSVALIGASDRPGSLGSLIWHNLTRANFTGMLYPVNPKRKSVGGIVAYKDFAALPEAPDLAIIVTPPETVPAIITQAGAAGTRAAVVISAGFDADLRQRMLDAARPYLMRLQGPNCLGLIVPPLGLNGSFAQLMPASGGVAFLSQSGAILTSVIDWADPRGIGFSHLVSLGEMADVDFGDLLDYLAVDPNVTAILMYAEAITSARKFMSAARRAARVKPVIVIKAGRHPQAAKAVASHTGALAGSDAVYDAAFRRAGMLRVYGLPQLFTAFETLAQSKMMPKGDRAVILTNGGGIGILATDAVIDAGVQLADLAPETMAKLNAVLPTTWSRGNPVDIIGDAPPERYGAALAALLEEPNADAIIALNCPTATSDASASAAAVIEAYAKSPKPLFTAWIGQATAAEARAMFSHFHIPSFETPEAAVRGFSHVVRYRRSQELLMETPPSMPTSFAADMKAVEKVIAPVLAEGRAMLTGPEAQAVLAAYGIPTSGAEIAPDAATAGAIADRLQGPVAVKILSPDISHKSDVGGVALNLRGAAEVARVAAEILARARTQRPEARVLGVTVEAMISRPGALELIVGATEDAQFGPVILFGEGGTAVEVIGDRALALPPLNLKLARDLMASTRIWQRLSGYRDRAPADLDAIALVLTKISQLIVDIPQVAELDINPLLADADGVIAVDARIRLRPNDLSGAARLAISPYPRELESNLVGTDGRAFLLRPIMPEDEPQVQALIRRLSPEAIRFRFFSSMRELSHRDAARFTQIDYDREMALILTEPGNAGEARIFGVVRLMADPDNETAEYSIVIEDALTGRGMGTALMHRILDYAKARGIGEVFGHVMKENANMLAICQALGFSVAQQPDDFDCYRVSLALR